MIFYHCDPMGLQVPLNGKMIKPPLGKCLCQLYLTLTTDVIEDDKIPGTDYLSVSLLRTVLRVQGPLRRAAGTLPQLPREHGHPLPKRAKGPPA